MTSAKEANIILIMEQVTKEVIRATRLFAPMNGPHEAAAVIQEEFDEFWDEVKKYNLNKGRDTRPAMREELIQLAAMAIRAVTDVIDKPDHKMILAPLPKGVEDTPEIRAQLQSLLENF